MNYYSMMISQLIDNQVRWMLFLHFLPANLIGNSTKSNISVND